MTNRITLTTAELTVLKTINDWEGCVGWADGPCQVQCSSVIPGHESFVPFTVISTVIDGRVFLPFAAVGRALSALQKLGLVEMSPAGFHKVITGRWNLTDRRVIELRGIISSGDDGKVWANQEILVNGQQVFDGGGQVDTPLHDIMTAYYRLTSEGYVTFRALQTQAVCLGSSKTRQPMTEGQKQVWDTLKNRVMTAPQLVKSLKTEKNVETSDGMVRQHILDLRNAGYDIPNRPGRGYYRADAPPSDLDLKK